MRKVGRYSNLRRGTQGIRGTPEAMRKVGQCSNLRFYVTERSMISSSPAEGFGALKGSIHLTVTGVRALDGGDWVRFAKRAISVAEASGWRVPEAIASFVC